MWRGTSFPHSSIYNDLYLSVIPFKNFSLQFLIEKAFILKPADEPAASHFIAPEQIKSSSEELFTDSSVWKTPCKHTADVIKGLLCAAASAPAGAKPNPVAKSKLPPHLAHPAPSSEVPRVTLRDPIISPNFPQDECVCLTGPSLSVCLSV